MDVDCAIASQTATCIETNAGPEANDPGTSTAVVSGVSDSLLPVTITAGLDLLSGGNTATATATGSGSTSGTTTEATTGASVTSSGATKTASSTASGTTSASAAATGAAHRTDYNVIVAWLAGLVGMAMML